MKTKVMLHQIWNFRTYVTIIACCFFRPFFTVCYFSRKVYMCVEMRKQSKSISIDVRIDIDVPSAIDDGKQHKWKQFFQAYSGDACWQVAYGQRIKYKPQTYFITFSISIFISILWIFSKISIGKFFKHPQKTTGNNYSQNFN